MQQHPLTRLLASLLLHPGGNPPLQSVTTVTPTATSTITAYDGIPASRFAWHTWTQQISQPAIAAWHTLQTDFQVIFERDPAARHWLEVLVCYPGLHAVWCHRLAHQLHQHGVYLLPRLISHLARLMTGIEIHPGAQIGQGVFIDHGMGVVIGETAIIGDYTLIYQGVTLGGTGKETGKRHPTLGSHVVVGAGAKVLGNIQVGNHARIGAGSIVLKDVPAYCTAVGVPGRNLCRATPPTTCPLDHGQLPDADAIVIRSLLDRIEQLETQIQQIAHSS